MESYSQQQWDFAHAKLGIQGLVSTFDTLLESWSEAGRFYHDTTHLDSGLHTLQHIKVESNLGDKDYAFLVLVWFFHDAVYKPESKTNEEDSALWFSDYASQVGLPEASIARGSDLIMFTKDHQGTETKDPLWPVLNDVDLAIFATDADTYAAYADDVWLEYERFVTGICDGSLVRGRRYFAAARHDFTAKFLQKSIYLTKVMQGKNAVAKQNIESEIARLVLEIN